MQHKNNAVRMDRGRMPLSLKVGMLVRRRMGEGEWRVGEQLPTLEDFMTEYGVSRATMRAAMADLESEGLIERGRGRGTFVTGDVSEERWLILPTDWQGLVEHIDHLSARVLTLEAGPRSPRLFSGEGVLAEAYWRAKRINWSEHVPYSLITLYLEGKIFRKHRSKFESGPALPLLARHFGSLIGQATQVLTISSADVDTAQHLRLEVGTPIAEARRIVRDRDGQVIYLGEVFYPAKHLRIETTMLPAPSRAIKS